MLGAMIRVGNVAIGNEVLRAEVCLSLDHPKPCEALGKYLDGKVKQGSLRIRRNDFQGPYSSVIPLCNRFLLEATDTSDPRGA